MLKIEKNNRLEIENEYLALLINKPELIAVNTIKPQYLFDEENKKILDGIIKCYSQFKMINPANLLKINKDFNIDLYIELMTDTFFYNKNYQEQIKHSEESIISFYKEDIIKSLNKKLESKEMEYKEFIKKMKQLDDINVSNNSNYLTIDEIENNINSGTLVSFKKYPKLGEMLKLTEGDLLVIGSMTGTGKTGFMLNLMSDLMEKYQCIYFNIEMSKPNIYKRILAINSGLAIRELEKEDKGFYQEGLINDAKKKIESSKVIIEHQTNKINEIRKLVSQMKDKTRHTIIFIDHLGLTKINGKQSLYEQMTEIMKELRNICLDYDCTIIGASQLNRTAYVSEEVSVSMLKDSGELENSARKIILLTRDKDSPKENFINKMNVQIAKNDNGSTGLIQMQYDKTKQIFKEM